VHPFLGYPNLGYYFFCSRAKETCTVANEDFRGLTPPQPQGQSADGSSSLERQRTPSKMSKSPKGVLFVMHCAPRTPVYRPSPFPASPADRSASDAGRRL
jgi:hypothetical protein